MPASALMEANHITSPAAVYPGQHLVIPRYRSGDDGRYAAADADRPTAPAMPLRIVPPHGALVAPSGTHVVAPGETLNSIARLYGKPVMVIARANNIPPDTMVRVGERIVIPEMGERPAPVAPRAEAPVAAAADHRRDRRIAAQRAASRRRRRRRPTTIRSRPTARRQARAELPLAGARPHHRRLRPEAERPAERRHQSRGAGRHAGQGGRGRRRRLCRQRAQRLRQSGAGAPRQRLRHGLRQCQRNSGQARRHRQTRPGDRACPARPAT